MNMLIFIKLIVFSIIQKLLIYRDSIVPYYPIMLKLAERNSLCHKTITFLFWFLKSIFLIHFKKYENQLSIWCKPLRIKRSVSMFSIQPKRLYQVLMFSFKKKKGM